MGFLAILPVGLQYRQHCRSNSYLSKWRQLPGKTEGKRWYLHRWNIKTITLHQSPMPTSKRVGNFVKSRPALWNLKPATDIVKAVWNYGDAASGPTICMKIGCFSPRWCVHLFYCCKSRASLVAKPTSMVASSSTIPFGETGHLGFQILWWSISQTYCTCRGYNLKWNTTQSTVAIDAKETGLYPGELDWSAWMPVYY